MKEILELAMKKGVEATKRRKEEIYSRPAKMAVVQRENQLDDTSPIKKAWPLHELCGFVSLWLPFQPFVRYLKKVGKVDTSLATDSKYWKGEGWELTKAYGGGFTLYIKQIDYIGGQGIDTKEAGYHEVERVLRDNGIECQVRSMLD